jgi:hypothetical protein
MATGIFVLNADIRLVIKLNSRTSFIIYDAIRQAFLSLAKSHYQIVVAGLKRTSNVLSELADNWDRIGEILGRNPEACRLKYWREFGSRRVGS